LSPHPHRPAPPLLGQALFVLGLSIGLFVALVVDRTARTFLDRDMELVRAVRDMAREEFVGEIAGDQLVDDALRGMLNGLDRYSTYYGASEVAELDRETSGEFLGLGVIFRAGEQGRILFAYPDSPADRAGLEVGDLIEKVDGRTVAGMEPDQLQEALHRDAALRLDVVDLAGDPRQVVVEPAVVLDPTVRQARILAGRPELGYLAIRSFSHRTPGEFDQAVQELTKQGMQALVLDLRGNPGGILDAAITIANRFIDAGAIVSTRTRTELVTTEARREEATLAGLPLVVLQDGRSASASEVLAAALQDHGAAVIVGEPSYGKGTVQTLKRVKGRDAVVKITTATYYSPSMRRIEHDDEDASRGGIAPDLFLPIEDRERWEIYGFLSAYSPPETARPALAAWEAAQGITLIGPPPADRQLEAAVALFSDEDLDLGVEPLR
jgi:carboxyl-terminal processing protease